MNKCYAIEGKDIFLLEDAINGFGLTHKIVATQIFPIVYDGNTTYDCMVWYEENKAEPILQKPIGDKIEEYKDKNKPATEKQVYALRQMGVKIPDGLTKGEAYLLIKDRKGR